MEKVITLIQRFKSSHSHKSEDFKEDEMKTLVCAPQFKCEHINAAICEDELSRSELINTHESGTSRAS